MNTEQYRILKRNLKGLDTFVDFVPALVRAALTVARQIEIKTFSYKFSSLFVATFGLMLKQLKIDRIELRDNAVHVIKRIVEKYSENNSMSMMDKIRGEVKDISKKILESDNFSVISDLTKRVYNILIVSYLEAYLRDFFILRINRQPTLGMNFLDRDLKINDIKDYGFDLSKNMGNLIGDRLNFQDLNEVTKAYKKAFGIDIFLGDSILKRKIKEMFNNRHILVHSNGIIDKRYILKVKKNHYQVGQSLKLKKANLEKYKKSILKIASNIESRIK